ncbi:unnamed protein product [Phytomonas sp. Hart1]|nr:unnamed protein product [Phytomonas sp. Hart1]|eukprot:CCW67568.1 unnamed protein product [Phytomonas sp. isolate Hart1]
MPFKSNFKTQMYTNKQSKSKKRRVFFSYLTVYLEWWGVEIYGDFCPACLRLYQVVSSLYKYMFLYPFQFRRRGTIPNGHQKKGREMKKIVVNRGHKIHITESWILRSSIPESIIPITMKSVVIQR